MNILTIIHEKEFIIAGSPVINSGRVSQEAINIFSNNFMRKLYESYPNYITKSCDIYYSFINTTSNNNRDEAIECFILGSIFILIFTSRHPSLADPALCATVFNYSETILFEFCKKIPKHTHIFKQPNI